MLKLSQIGVSGNTAKRSVTVRLMVVLFLGVFIFQLARVFIVIDDCTHHGTSGYTLEHCKGLPDGLIAPVQLGETSSPAPQVTLEVIRESLPSQTDTKPDPPLFSFFHPPKNLS